MMLTDFLLARIAEEESIAQAATPGLWAAAPYMPEQTDEPFRDWYDNASEDAPVYELTGPSYTAGGTWAMWHRGDAVHIASQDPARTLARCAAYRQIVERCGPYLDPFSHRADRACTAEHELAEDTLRALASVYAGADGWREEWA